MTIVLAIIAIGAVIYAVKAESETARVKAKVRHDKEMAAHRKIESLQAKADAGDVDAQIEIIVTKQSVGWTV